MRRKGKALEPISVQTSVQDALNQSWTVDTGKEVTDSTQSELDEALRTNAQF